LDTHQDLAAPRDHRAVRLDRLNYDSSALLLACGLALRSFD